MRSPRLFKALRAMRNQVLTSSAREGLKLGLHPPGALVNSLNVVWQNYSTTYLITHNLQVDVPNMFSLPKSIHFSWGTVPRSSKKLATLPPHPARVASTIMQAPISQPCSGRSFGMKMYPLLLEVVGCGAGLATLPVNRINQKGKNIDSI